MGNTATVGSRIKSIRKAKNITVDQVAERSGLTLEQVCRIEENRNLPSLAPLVRIARALGVRLGTFLDDSDNLGPVICRKEDQVESISFPSETANSHNNLNFLHWLHPRPAGTWSRSLSISIRPRTAAISSPRTKEKNFYTFWMA